MLCTNTFKPRHPRAGAVSQTLAKHVDVTMHTTAKGLTGLRGLLFIQLPALCPAMLDCRFTEAAVADTAAGDAAAARGWWAVPRDGPAIPPASAVCCCIAVTVPPLPRPLPPREPLPLPPLPLPPRLPLPPLPPGPLAVLVAPFQPKKLRAWPIGLLLSVWPRALPSATPLASLSMTHRRG